MNKLGDDIMAKFDKLISDFGNTAEILQAASKDLAADNQAAAAAEYGRTETNKFKKLCESLPCETSWGDNLTPAIAEHIYDASHSACDCREAALKNQIQRLVSQGEALAFKLAKKISFVKEIFEITGSWHEEVKYARELIK